jgi:hypothetical protein
MFTHGQTVTILRESSSGVDAYGDPVTSITTRVEVTGCAVAPRMSTEPTERGRQGVIVGLSLYAPTGTDVRYTDRVEIDGAVYLVDGIPAEWVSPFTGWAPGLEVALRRAEG